MSFFENHLENGTAIIDQVEIEPTITTPSLFGKCETFFEAGNDYQTVQEADLYPYFRPIERNDGTHAVMNGHDVIMAGSNNYLGLTSDPRVMEAAKNAIDKYGTGCTGSRFLNGTLDIHLELEERLARFLGKEKCILFSTGYMTNQGVIQGLTSKNDLIFSDKDNHASIIAGTSASMSKTIRYRHNDIEHLKFLLERVADQNPNTGKLIVTDGVFSMSGLLARVPELVELAEEFDAALLLDDAHAIGVIGPGGRGSAAHFNLSNRAHLTTGTFSKSFSSIGGFCVGEEEVIDFIRHSASTHIFSASMPPPTVATVLKCLDILEEEPERLERLQEISDYMRSGFANLGFNVWNSNTPIIPVVIGEMMTCFHFWKDLLEAGVFANAVIPPAVPKGFSLMRTSYMATHTDDDLNRILDAFEKVGKKHGIIRSNGTAGEHVVDSTNGFSPNGSNTVNGSSHDFHS